MKKSLISSLLICASLTGCSTLSISENEQNLRKAIMTESEFVQTYTIQNDYWTLLEIPELNQLIEQLHQRNTALKKAKIGMELSQLQTQFNILNFLIPHIGHGLGYTKATQIDNHQSNSQEGYQVQGSLNYEANLIQKINAAHQAHLNTTATQEDIKALELALENQLIQYYISWNINQSNQSQLNEILLFYPQLEEHLKLNYQYGKLSKLDYENAKLQLLQLQNQKSQLLNEQYEIEGAIRNLLSYQPQEPLNLKVYPLSSFNQLPSPNLNIPLSAITYRPDVKASLYRLDQKWFDLHHQYLNWLPKISLNVGITSSGLDLGQTFSLPIGLTQGIGLSLPFLNLPQRLVETKQSQFLLQKAVLEFEETLIKALNEVAFLKKKYTMLNENLPAVEERYQHALKIKQIRDWQYAQHIISLSQYTQSIEDFMAEQKTYLYTVMSITQTKLSMYQALGGYIVPKK